MKIRQTINALFLAGAFLLCGCITMSDIPWPKSDPQPLPPVEQPKPVVESQWFLWKPKSENTGTLVVLIPARFDTTACFIETESFASEKGRRRAKDGANGNRDHYYFSLPGSDYGNNVRVRAIQGADTLAQWTVPRGAERHEER